MSFSVVAYGNPGGLGTYAVDDNGNYIGYPIGHVPVAGMTPPEVGEDITRALSAHVAGLDRHGDQRLRARVRIGRYCDTRQLVNRPGMIVLELVALGGGQRNTIRDGYRSCSSSRRGK